MLELISFLDTHDGAFMVIITFVYVIATIKICKANLRSADATREQVEETKRQYEEEHRAFISYEFFYEHRVWYGLRFTNHGKRIATDVQIKLDKAFLDSIVEPKFRDSLSSLDGRAFTLGIGQSYDVYLGTNAFRARKDKIPVQGTIEYKDRNSAYSEPFQIDFANYPHIFSVTTNGERAEDAIKRLNKNVASITAELKHIGAKLPQEQKQTK